MNLWNSKRIFGSKCCAWAKTRGQGQGENENSLFLNLFSAPHSYFLTFKYFYKSWIFRGKNQTNKTNFFLKKLKKGKKLI